VFKRRKFNDKPLRANPGLPAEGLDSYRAMVWVDANRKLLEKWEWDRDPPLDGSDSMLLSFAGHREARDEDELPGWLRAFSKVVADRLIAECDGSSNLCPGNRRISATTSQRLSISSRRFQTSR
jgi:hypothetical protein